MTKLPVESWNIKPRLDLPRYDLNEFCPITGEVPEPGSHHIVRKSFTALGREDNARLYWVELEDGEVIGNRIRLSSQAHFRITTNRAAIVYTNGVYYWDEAGERVPLRWQPPTLHRRKNADQWVSGGHEKFETQWIELDPAAEAQVERTREVMDAENIPVGPIPGKASWLEINPAVTFPADPEAQELGGYSEAPSEGEECKLCRRRVPHKKKASSPSTKVFSCRIPIDDAETFSEIVDAAAEHAGMKSKPHHVYNTLLVGMALVLQAPKEDLPDVG